MLLLVALLFAQLGAPVGWSSARPPECGALDNGRGANVWERAKAPELKRYCDLLASGASKLASGGGMAREALEISEQADRAMKGRAGPCVLRGRALARLGRAEEALAALREAKSRDERALDDPQTLLAWARVLARTGSADDAAQAYRSLLPRATTLTLADRGAASVEAGMLSLARGPAGTEEAIAILRQARRDSQDVVQSLAVMALALALDRAGDKDEARAVLGERSFGDPRIVLGEPRVKESLATVGASAESSALAGLALEAGDPAAAREAWKAYLESAKGPWGGHARMHEAGLGGRSRVTGRGAGK
jgi:tetratricopeptide (TPR) repeat protein